MNKAIRKYCKVCNKVKDTIKGGIKMKIMGYEIKETEPRKAFRIKRDNITLKEPETNKKAKEQFQRKPYYLQTIK